MIRTFIYFALIFSHYHVISNDNHITVKWLSETDLYNVPIIFIDKPYPNHVIYKDDVILNSFYPADLYQVIKNVRNMEDCSVLCRIHEKCRTFAFHPNLHKCYMFEVNEFSDVKFFGELKTILVKSMDLKNLKGSKRPTRLDGGVLPKRCGEPFPFRTTVNNNRRKRIFGGKEALPYYSLPWMVQVIINGRLCSGTLYNANHIAIVTRYVLTAASCVVNTLNGVALPKAAKIHMVAGFHDVRFTQPFEQWNTVRRVFVPENLTADLNDIAILEADKYFAFNQYVRPVCLPREIDSVPNIADPQQQECFIAGWGVTKAQQQEPGSQVVLANKIYSPVLKRAQVFVLQHQENPAYYTLSTNIQKCGGLTCEGDMGGPMFCKKIRPTHGPYYIVYGVVNLWDLPVNDGQPVNRCINLVPLRQWIQQVTRYATYRQNRPPIQILKLEP